MSTLLSVHNLRKIYNEKSRPHQAVDGISFNLRAGEILGLLGPNGSGKTTTVQMLLGTLSITSGSVLYFGKDFQNDRSNILQSVSFASTYNSLPWLLTVRENLEVIGRFHGLSAKQSQKQFEPLLERFGLLDKKNTKVAFLSSGQVTGLMLVKAFFIQPKIILLDEPTASLDPNIAKEICNFILEQREKLGLSILFTSHKMQEVAELCDRLIFLKQGKIIADDIPKKLAQSISSARLKLLVNKGMEKIVTLVEKDKLFYTINQQQIVINIDEARIPEFLISLHQAEIGYSNIKIEEPSLEDYFLEVTRK